MIRDLLECLRLRTSIRRVLRNYGAVALDDFATVPLRDLSQVDMGKAVLMWIAEASHAADDLSVRIMEEGDYRVYNLHIVNRRGVIYIRSVKENNTFAGRKMYCWTPGITMITLTKGELQVSQKRAEIMCISTLRDLEIMLQEAYDMYKI